MRWRWDELTAKDFPVAVDQAEGVCLVPFGVLEKHGDHLPVGTDAMVVEAVAARAVAKEPVIQFPVQYYGEIQEAKHVPGAIAIKHQLFLDLLMNLFDEIARNGLKKIVLLNGHGGNETFLPLLSMMMLEEPRDYSLYIIRLGDYLGPVNNSPEWKAQMVSPFDYHGGEAETSSVLAVRPDLVKMEDISDTGQPQRRLSHMPSVLVAGIWWHADYPDHYAGDATHATVEKGEWLMEHYAEKVVTILKAVKADNVARALQDEFFSRLQQ